MITPIDITIAQHVIYTSGAAEKFRAALTNERGGRKPTFDQALFLLGMFLSSSTHAKTHIRLIHKVLTEEVPIDQQFTWGIRRATSDSEAWVLSEVDLQNVSRSLKRALNYGAFLPSKLRGNDAEIARRKNILNELTDLLIDATLIPRPADGQDYAIDDSGIWAGERSPFKIPTSDEGISEGDEETTPIQLLPNETESKPTELLARKPRKGISDAELGVKTSKAGKRTSYYGYALHAIVRVPNKHVDGMRTEAPLIERMRLTPAARDVVDVSLEIIDSVRAKHQKIRYLHADRHYSYKRIDRWLYQLLNRGIEQVVQLRQEDYGFREWDGMLFVAGHAHCPATPRHLGDIKQPGLDASHKDFEDFYKQIDEREAYAAQNTHRLTSDGKSRWRCPALNGTIGCQLRAGTIHTARQTSAPEVKNPPKHPPAICTEKSVSVTITKPEQAVIMKTHQKHYWGSRTQVTLNGRRTFVEGWFGTLKGDSSASKKRGSSLYTGIAHAIIETTMFACVANVINLRAWHKETELGDATHPVLSAKTTSYGYLYLDEDEYSEQVKLQANISANR